MNDRAGLLAVGVAEDAPLVVVHFQNLEMDADGFGWIAFSPDQARNFAASLTTHADAISQREQRRTE